MCGDGEKPVAHLMKFHLLHNGNLQKEILNEF